MDNPPPDMPLREAVLIWGEILCIGGETAQGDHLPGAVAAGRVRVSPRSLDARVTQVLRRMSPAGMMRMMAGLHAFLSILQMELVVAVNDVVQRAQNGERGFGPDDATVLMQTGRGKRNRSGKDGESPPPTRPKLAKGNGRRRRMMRRRRSAVAYYYEVASCSATTRGAPRWGQTMAASCQRAFMGELPEEGHVGIPRALREHLQQCLFARGPMSAVAMLAGLLRMVGALLMDLGVIVETYLVEQQLFDEAVGMPVPTTNQGVPEHFQPVPPVPEHGYGNPTGAEQGTGTRDEVTRDRGRHQDGEDETSLMQNGVQLGYLEEQEVAALSEDLYTKLVRVKRADPTKGKDLLFAVGAVVARNALSKLPSVRQACEGLRKVLDKVAEEVREEARVRDHKNDKWAKQFWRRVRNKCRSAAAKSRRQQARAMAMAQMVEDENRGVIADGLEQPEPEPENEELALVQTGMWLETLQEDLDFRRTGGERVGAHANQLMAHLRDLQIGANPEMWQAVEALLATYVGEEADEARGDLADSFASCWRGRLEVLLFQDAGMVEDTPETEREMEEVEKVMKALKREAHKRKLQETARKAQREDDLALRAAMAESASGGGSSASTEAMPEMAPAKSQRKRCLSGGS